MDGYSLTPAQYERLIHDYGDLADVGWEDWGLDDNGNHLVGIWDDAILSALGLGDYTGGDIHMHGSQEGGAL